jgi:PAS domain-containing protein
MWDYLALALALGATSVLAAFGGLAVLTLLQWSAPQRRPASIFREGEDATVFLFDDKDLVDATPSAHRLLSGSSFIDRPWYALMERLAVRFENLEERLEDLVTTGSVVLNGLPRAGAQHISLRADLRGGLTKITLVNPGREANSHWGDVLTVHALDSELVELRDATNAAPFPMWRLTKEGEITWANASYMELLCRAPITEMTANWPLPAIFDLTHEKGDVKTKPLRRLSPDRSGWFDVVVRPVSDGLVCYALPADVAVVAEASLQDFKQTLANTFAELSTGLAVFDHTRRLQLFNPALAKLIDVPVELLLKRPALFTLLDGMRDRNMLPEPKDYKSWRRQMVDLEAMSVRGEYRETWYLPNGRAFQVVGRPYPNGAVALMIDDVTDQVVRDRLFRAELDVALAVLNQVDEAVIVLSAVGRPVFANARYRALWGHDPVAMPPKDGAIELLEGWRAATASSVVWSAMESVISGSRSEIPQHAVQLHDGRQLVCRVTFLNDGASCVFFRERPSVNSGSDEEVPYQRAASA